MPHALIKTGAALLVLGGFAVAAPALAASPLPLNATPFVTPVADEENEEVWQDLRPDVTPPPAAVGTEKEAPKNATPEQPKGEGSGNVEQKELQEEGVEPK